MTLGENASNGVSRFQGKPDTISVPDRSVFRNEHEYRRHVETTLSSFEAKLDVAKRQQLGYPIVDQGKRGWVDLTPLARFDTHTLNNVGDPQNAGVFSSHSHPFELGVLEWFAELFDMDDFWGYVAGGGSESNIEALFIARESLPAAMTYVSADAHYSVLKALRVLRMNYEVIATTETGEIDYSDLERALNASPYRHAIVVATCGTTMRGAIDSPRKIVDLLESCRITEFYLHVDAALSGIFVPLVDPPRLSFAQVAISSIAVSGHKFLGAPIPSSVFLVRRKIVDGMTNSQVQYIGSNDLPMACSRNGLYDFDRPVACYPAYAHF
jgi:histidine decarboxylase